MAVSSLFYYNDQLGKVVPNELVLQWKITAAKTVVPIVANSAHLTAFDAIASQSVIDGFLGTTNEFLVAAFDATAMGANAFAVILDMNGQAKSLLSVSARVLSGSNGATVAECGKVAEGLTASTLVCQGALGSQGNLAGRFVLSGLDALTSGLLEVRFCWVAK
jgi:hypothetical protein